MPNNKFDQAAYTAAYNKENYARIELKVSKGKKARWELQAKAAGMSRRKIRRVVLHLDPGRH